MDEWISTIELYESIVVQKQIDKRPIKVKSLFKYLEVFQLREKYLNIE